MVEKKRVIKLKEIKFIAELGINFNSSIDIAKQMIDMAALFGADYIKFQKRTPEICVPMDQRSIMKETPWGNMTYFDYKKKMEFSAYDYAIIDAYCKSKKIKWFASVWDIPSVDFMEQFNPPFYKIPSAQLTNKELLEKVKSTGKNIIISLGMSTQEEIDKAIKILGGPTGLIIMHCNSAYPVDNEDMNLNYITTLTQKYPTSCIGYSGHEVGVSPTLVAATLGAEYIERHITLDRAMWGTDQAASLGPDGLRRLIRDLKLLPLWLGSRDKIVTETEQRIKKKLRNVESL